MPKQVDHAGRRREIAAAVWRIAAAHGLEAVSLGQVATEAGMSKGLVQHYFRSKDEMLAHATGLLRERVGARVERRLAESAADSAAGTLRALLLALLPTDDDSRTEALVGNAFLIRAIRDETVADRFRSGQSELRGIVASLIADGQHQGQLDPALNPDREADILLAIVGGMGDALLLGGNDIAEATSIVDYQLARIAA